MSNFLQPSLSLKGLEISGANPLRGGVNLAPAPSIRRPADLRTRVFRHDSNNSHSSFERVIIRLSGTINYMGEKVLYARLYRKDMTVDVPIGATEGLTAPTLQWTTGFSVTYHFKRAQTFMVKIFSATSTDQIPPIDTPESSLSSLAQCTFALTDLMSSSRQTKGYDLSGAVAGRINLVGEICAGEGDSLKCKITLTDIVKAKKNFMASFSVSAYSYRLLRAQQPSGDMKLLYKSGIRKKTNAPSWELQIPTAELKDPSVDTATPIRLDFYDGDILLGMATTSLQALLNNSIEKALTADVMADVGGAVTAKLTASEIKLEKSVGISEYIAGGCEISLIVGIDFTQSNGKVHDPRSLHHMADDRLNAYEQAITSIGKVLEPYDSNRRFPVFGFGGKIAKVLRNNKVQWQPTSHLFSLVDIVASDANITPIAAGSEAAGIKVDGADPLSNKIYKGETDVFSEVEGIDNVVQVYRRFLKTGLVEFADPTNFSPLIRHVIGVAKGDPCSNLNQNYYVLLILTDGEISERNEFLQALIEASKEQISVIIVGVGEASFDNMEELLQTENDLPLEVNGKRAMRNVVQFVRQRDFGEELAANVLQQIPAQFLKYMETNGIAPKPQA